MRIGGGGAVVKSGDQRVGARLTNGDGFTGIEDGAVGVAPDISDRRAWRLGSGGGEQGGAISFTNHRRAGDGNLILLGVKEKRDKNEQEAQEAGTKPVCHGTRMI